MALSFIGKPISLISHSDVRYRGILAGIDPVNSTIQLSNVYSMGTESRRPPNQFIAPVPDPYAYIIFRASEVKDLAVDEPAAAPSVHDDPAVLNASAPGPPAQYGAYPAQANAAPPAAPPTQQNPPQQQYTQQPPAPAPAVAAAPQTQPPSTQPAPSTQNQNRTNQNGTQNRRNPVQTAAASLESVERALGDLRVSSGSSGAVATGTGHHTGGGRGRRGGRGGGRGGAHHTAEQIQVPTTDFDFESSNAKFDKNAILAAATSKDTTANGTQADGAETAEGEDKKEGDAHGAPAYNPKTSFFDSLSSSAATPNEGGQRGGGRGRRGGGVAGRNRREEEREKNVATFGEPGGVGLLGPGGYVGGWGGYGRRGGGRPRRGGPGGGGRGGNNNNSNTGNGNGTTVPASG